MGVYDVSSANTNRVVRFLVEPASAGDRNAALFGILKGRNDSYPNYGRLTTVPTNNQELAALRTSLVARALSRYAILVGVKLAQDSAGTGSPGTANFSSALELWFEVNESGVFYNNNWAQGAVPTITNFDKHTPGNASDGTAGTYADTVGVGGMTTPKTKPDLNGILNSIKDISYDGGTTGPFGSKSSTGNITLPNGAVTSAAPVLSTSSGGPNGSGLLVRVLR